MELPELPPLPLEGENPWYEKRQAWDGAVGEALDELSNIEQTLDLLKDTGWRNIQSLVAGYLTGKIMCRRVGATVEIAAESLQVSGTGTFDFTDPLGAGWSPSRPLYTKGSDYWSDSVAATVRVWTDGKMRGQFGSVVDPKVHFQMVYTTTDAWPSTLPGTAA